VTFERLIKVAKDETPSGAALSHLRGLLEDGHLDALLIPVSTGGGRSYVHSLVTDPKELEDADPFAPVMPVNGAIALSRLTKLQAPSGRVGVVLRPCEIAAAIELQKLLQVRLKDVTVIGVDCPGTISVQDHIDLVDKDSDPMDVLAKDPSLLRRACITCDWTEVQYHDLLLGSFGTEGEHIVAISDDETLVGSLDKASKKSLDDRERAKERIIAIREAATEGGRKEIADNLQGAKAFARHFEICIVCHNCMENCPVCYCNECFFESQTFRYEGDKMMLWARNRGSLSMPTDKSMFHLGRMGHMVATCIGCGMCTQACPVGIDVGVMFKHVASQVQPEFEYKAGRSIDDPLPQATYLEDELEPR
jgi:formate dehydrogenase subunit beta